jgi:diketogulonate reductase-like aldo/keto reductase
MLTLVLMGDKRDFQGGSSPWQKEEPMTDDQVRALSDGNSIPLLGLGVWQVPDGTQTVNAVRWALELGYRHLDTAQAYGNEDGVGRGLRESGVPREDVFITTKFNPNRSDPARELEGSLKRLGVDQVDLYLVHWPHGGPLRAWPGMERAKERGLARSIGVSNYSAAQLEQVVESGTVPPVVDQVQFSAMEYRRGVLAAAERRDIVLESYSSLGTGRHLSDPRVVAIADRVSRTPAQVLLRWCVQHGVPVIPKSTHRERIAENADLFSFTLSDEDMTALNALDTTGGTDQANESTWW